MASLDTSEKKVLEQQDHTDHASGEVRERKTSLVSKLGEVVNASGHRDQLQRQYGLLSICG